MRCPVGGDTSGAGSRLVATADRARGCEGVGLWVPLVEMSKDSFDHIDIVDERDDTHVTAAVYTLKRIDLVDLLNQRVCNFFCVTASFKRSRPIGLQIRS